MTQPAFTLVDVGARGTLDARWRRFADSLRVIAIDADEAAPVHAEGAARHDVIRAAVGAALGPSPFYITRSAGSSSTLRPNRALLARFPEAERFDVVNETTLVVQPLDEVLGAAGVTGVDFLKLDTQGSELAILEGAPVALASAVGVEVEVEFVQMYEGQPTFGDVDRFLTARGFELFDLNRVYWRRRAGPPTGRGQLIFADALYLRSVDSLLDVPADGGRRLASAVLAAAAYGYVDYARTLLAAGEERRGFGEGTAELAATWLARVDHGPGRLARLTGAVRGFGSVSRALARLADALRPDHWAYADGRLGNSRK